MNVFDARSFLIQLLEIVSDGVFALDERGRVVVWNAAMERMLGKSRDEAIGAHLYEALPFYRETGEDWLVKDALSGTPRETRDQVYFVPETGKEGAFRGIYLPIRDAAGSVTGVLCVVRDVTATKKAVDAAVSEVRRREAALRALLARAAAGGGDAGEDERGGAAAFMARRMTPRSRAGGLARMGGPESAPGRAASRPGPESAPPVENRPLPADPEPQIFDAGAALEFLGSEDVLREMIDGFVASLPAVALELDRAVIERNFRAVVQQAQALKTATASLGGHRATWVAARLELLAQDQRGEELKPMWLRLRRELALMREAVVQRIRSAA
jgi:PAS domain S-box-containing protein